MSGDAWVKSDGWRSSAFESGETVKSGEEDGRDEVTRDPKPRSEFADGLR